MKQSLSLRTRPGKVSVTSTCPGGKCRNLVFSDHSTSRTPEHYITHAQTQLSTSRNRLTSTIHLAATWLSDVHGSEWGRAEGINLLTAGSGSKGLRRVHNSRVITSIQSNRIQARFVQLHSVSILLKFSLAKNRSEELRVGCGASSVRVQHLFSLRARMVVASTVEKESQQGVVIELEMNTTTI